MQVPPRPFAVTMACLTVVASWLLAVVPVTVAQLDMMLIHIGDMHSHFDETDLNDGPCIKRDKYEGKCYGGFSRVTQFVRDAKQEAFKRQTPPLFVVTGDTFRGSLCYSLFGWKPVAEFMDKLRPDVMSVGSNEFKDGINSKLVPYLNATRGIPAVLTNLNTSIRQRLNRFLFTSYTFTLNHTKVGIVGYLTTDTMTSVHVGKTDLFDEIESLKKETKKLRDDGVNIIIALGQSGIEKDKEVAREVEDIDLIVGGHSHTFLYSGEPPSIEKPYGPYPYYVKNHKNKSIPILHAYAFTRYIGKVDLKFDANGELVSINGSPTLLDHKIPEHFGMMNLARHWRIKVSSKASVVVGRTAVELSNDCRYTECNLGNFIADSFVFLNILKKTVYRRHWTDASIGIVGSDNLCASVVGKNYQGYINMKKLINTAPHGYSIVKSVISGSDLLEAFEHSVFNLSMVNKTVPTLQVSGVFVEFDLSQSPGNRVTSLRLRCNRCSIPKYEPLEMTNNYTILMDSNLAEGKGGYTAFTKVLWRSEVLEADFYNAPIDYIRRVTPIITGIEGRIRFKNDIVKLKQEMHLVSSN